jgi:hypothetical protein
MGVFQSGPLPTIKIRNSTQNELIPPLPSIVIEKPPPALRHNRESIRSRVEPLPIDILKLGYESILEGDKLEGTIRKGTFNPIRHLRETQDCNLVDPLQSIVRKSTSYRADES